MKRTTLALDEDLLKEALQITGERTYSGVVNKALREVVRVAKLRRGIEIMRNTPDFFTPGYLESIRPNSWLAVEKREAEARSQRNVKSRGRSSR